MNKSLHHLLSNGQLPFESGFGNGIGLYVKRLRVVLEVVCWNFLFLVFLWMLFQPLRSDTRATGIALLFLAFSLAGRLGFRPRALPAVLICAICLIVVNFDPNS